MFPQKPLTLLDCELPLNCESILDISQSYFYCLKNLLYFFEIPWNPDALKQISNVLKSRSQLGVHPKHFTKFHVFVNDISWSRFTDENKIDPCC